MNLKQKNWIILFIVAFIWGSPYILREIALKSFTNGQVAALQIFLSSILFSPFLIKSISKLNKKNALIILCSGLAGNVAPSVFFAKAQTQISSSMTGMLTAMLPMITLLIAIVFFKVKWSKSSIIGIFLGFAGTMFLVFLGENYGASQFWGVFYVFLAMIAVAISINIISFSLPKLNGTEIASLAFMFVGPMAGIYLLFSDWSLLENSEDLQTSSMMIAILVAITFSGVLLYNKLIKESSHLFAASISYIIPIVAIFWGLLIGGDSINIMHIIAIIIILFSIHLVQKN